MNPVELTVDVHCEIVTDFQRKIIYRLFVNDELFMERPWVWGNKYYIKENIVINSHKGIQHKIKIVPYHIFLDSALTCFPLEASKEHTKFNINNLSCNSGLTAVEQVNDLEISFII